MTPASTDKNRAVRLAAAIVVMLSASMMTLAQQSSGNYVRVTEHLDAFGSQTRSTTTYYNGMGWPVETVQSGYNSQGTDIATLTEYDGNGRAVRQWERTAVSGYSNGESFTYDMMGNVTQIERRGMQDDDTYSPIDDLILTYDGNQISKKQERNIIKNHDISNADNFVKITGSQAIRNSVVSKIGDDGTGGSADINNREYLIFFDTTNPDEEVMGLRIGPVADPSKANTVGVAICGLPSLTYIHTHPSGEKKGKNWAQAPSMQDINNATSTSYVIGMRDKIVYIYEGFGIKATLNLDVYKNYIVGKGIRP